MIEFQYLFCHNLRNSGLSTFEDVEVCKIAYLHKPHSPPALEFEKEEYMQWQYHLISVMTGRSWESREDLLKIELAAPRLLSFKIVVDSI
jgi:hypothetical protein